MTLSRMHLGMLGVVSIFTGVISPVVSNNIASFPFPLTELQIPSYLILISLAIICILITIQSWLWARLFSLIVLGLIGYVFVVTWGGNVHTTTGILAPSLSWGWVFLFIGSCLLISSLFDWEDTESTTTLSDHLIWWLGAFAIITLTGVIISISYISRSDKSDSNRILSGVFGSGSTETHSGITRSRGFTSIHQLFFDRKHDTLSFFVSSGTSMISIPNWRIFDRLPYTTTSIDNILYTVSAEWLVTTENWVLVWKAILPQQIEWSLLLYSGNTLMSISNNGVRSYSWEYSTIEDIITSKIWSHTIWKSKTGTGYTIYKDGLAQWQQQNEVTHISISSDGESIMSLVRDIDGSQYIMKNGTKIEQIGKGYIEGTLRMNGTERIYAVERNNVIELIFNWAIIDRKFDEIREVFLDHDGSGYSYFGRPLGEQNYCFYTRYRGNLCGLTGYMNPRQTLDGLSIVYAWLKDGVWWIYKNVYPLIRNTGYPNRDDISRDYVFFDITNPFYYLFIRWNKDTYQLFKKWSWIEWNWKDIWLDVTFWYDNKVIMSVQDNDWWHVIEF